MDAVSVQLPLAFVTLTWLPDTEQPVDPLELNVSAPVPLPPDEVIVTAVPLYVRLAGPVTLNVACVAKAAFTVRTTLVAALKLVLPACAAVSVQAVEPLVIVTEPLLIEQPPEARTDTASPESDVGATLNMVLYVAGVVGWANVIVWLIVCAFVCALVICGAAE
jgi:hypothetical protein